LLLLLRCVALALLVLAFARPFFRASALGFSTSGVSEVVILIDRSYSMSYGDHWNRAKIAANNVIEELSSDDRATLIFFDRGAVQAGPRSTTDHTSLRGFVNGAELSSGSTRFGPALELAERLLQESSFLRHKVVLISDFQQSGVESVAGVRFPTGTLFSAVPIQNDRSANVSVTGVSFEREYFSGRERVMFSARITNRSNDPVDNIEVALDVGEREIERLSVSLLASESATVDFKPVTFEAITMIGAIRISSDQLPTDDTFYFTAAPGELVNVLLISSNLSNRDANLYLTRALGIGSSPTFDVTQTTVGSFAVSDLSNYQVVVLNDVPSPSEEIGLALEKFVEEGGGLLFVSGERSAWSEERLKIFPGTVEPPIDRVGRGGSFGFVDYSHPIFELFGMERSGDVTTARFFRYRPIDVSETATVLANYDNGSPALVEHHVGKGKVLFWASTLDNFWNDLALKPVYLPFVHRLTEHLASYTPPVSWFLAGQVLDLGQERSLLSDFGLEDADLVAISPSGQLIPVTEAEQSGFINLVEQGFYEIHDASTTSRQPLILAVNVDLSESDLSAVDPDEFASYVTGRANQNQSDLDTVVQEVSSKDLERRQRIWWYLLIAAVLFLVSETVISNRLSRHSMEMH
jgi:hypothetical protein